MDLPYFNLVRLSGLNANQDTLKASLGESELKNKRDKEIIKQKSKKYIDFIEKLDFREQKEYFRLMVEAEKSMIVSNYCYKDVIKFLISADGKYLFVYSYYKNISVISLWDLITKSVIEIWKLKSRSFLVNKELKKLMICYPECVCEKFKYVVSA